MEKETELSKEEIQKRNLLALVIVVIVVGLIVLLVKALMLGIIFQTRLTIF